MAFVNEGRAQRSDVIGDLLAPKASRLRRGLYVTNVSHSDYYGTNLTAARLRPRRRHCGVERLQQRMIRMLVRQLEAEVLWTEGNPSAIAELRLPIKPIDAKVRWDG